MGYAGNDEEQRLSLQQFNKRYLFPGCSAWKKVPFIKNCVQYFYVWVCNSCNIFCHCYFLFSGGSIINNSILHYGTSILLEAPGNKLVGIKAISKIQELKLRDFFIPEKSMFIS